MRLSSKLLVQTSPFLRHGVTTPALMGDVVISLLPVLAAAIWYFGISAILVVVTASLGAVLTEWALGGSPRGLSLRDGSAAVTGIILGLTLPPGFPLWMAFIGGVAGMGLGKLVWGGLGNNLFNPALVGRAFLQAAFPTSITTWNPPTDPWVLRGSNLALPFMQVKADVVTTATPLNLFKFDHQLTDLPELFTGAVAGSLGETSAALILVAGLWMLARRTFDWRIPASILLTVAALSGILYWISPEKFPSPPFMLLSGGLLFGSIYMATDPVTSPTSPRGAWLFGFGIGFLVVLIRVWGGLPEGVMYAILLMNSTVPLIERVTQPRIFGRLRSGSVRPT